MIVVKLLKLDPAISIILCGKHIITSNVMSAYYFLTKKSHVILVNGFDCYRLSRDWNLKIRKVYGLKMIKLENKD